MYVCAYIQLIDPSTVRITPFWRVVEAELQYNVNLQPRLSNYNTYKIVTAVKVYYKIISAQIIWKSHLIYPGHYGNLQAHF